MNKKNKSMDSTQSFAQEFTPTENIIFRRRSVRLYQKKQVPEFMIKRILEAGRFAPSAGNAQPWKFIVLRDQDIIKDMTRTVLRLVKVFRAVLDYRRPGFYWLRPLASLFIRLNRYELHPVPFGAVDLIAREKLGLWHDAPTVILIFKDVRGVGNPDIDCGIAGQNMVLAAQSLGLGTCWVSFAKPAFKYSLKWKRRFGIAYPYKFASSLAVGWPVGEPDGMVQRETHAVDWYEDGSKKTVF
jgi:nitroreductase